MKLTPIINVSPYPGYYLKDPAVSDTDLSLYSKRRIGKGGVALMWHITHDKFVSPLVINDDRIVGIQV